MKKVKRRCEVKRFHTNFGTAYNVQCGIKNKRKNFNDETVLIAVPLSEDKLFCFPSLIQCLKNLLATTTAKCTVAFALNDEDEGMAAAVKDCGIPHVIIPTERPTELPSELLGYFAAAGVDTDRAYLHNEFLWLNFVALARNALREHAISSNSDWLFFLDADTVIEPNGLNRLLSYGTDISSVYSRNRGEEEDGHQRMICFLFGKGIGRLPGTLGISHKEAMAQPSPMFNSVPFTSTCLIHKRVFTALRFHFGYVPLQPYENIDMRNCTPMGRFLSEDTFFGYDAAAHGFTSVLCHRTKSIHFLFEGDYPKGSANKGEDVTYSEYITPESSQNAAHGV